MNKKRILSDLADELRIPQNGSNSFEGQKSSDVTDFFGWVVDLFRDDGNPSVTVTVVDMLPNLLLFSSTNGNHTKIFTPYPTNNYKEIVHNVAMLFNSHPSFEARIQADKIYLSFTEK